MNLACELNDLPQHLQLAVTQIEAISRLEARHAEQLNALHTRHTTEASNLQARQAQDKQTALQGVLGLYERLAAALASGQHDVQQVSLLRQFARLIRLFAC